MWVVDGRRVGHGVGGQVPVRCHTLIKAQTNKKKLLIKQ